MSPFVFPKMPVTLDHLPTEIKANIICRAPDLRTLQAFVRASPVFHAVYLSNREHILRELLVRSIGLPVALDAITVVLALRARKEGLRNAHSDIVENFIYQYGERVKTFKKECETFSQVEMEKKYANVGLDFFEISPPLATDEIFEMARLHSTVQTLSEDVAQSCLNLVPDAYQEWQGNKVLSASETRRVQRALYRVEVYRLLFADRPLIFSFFFGSHYDQKYAENCRNYQTDIFFKIFESWGFHEMLCVMEYMLRVFAATVDWDILPVKADSGISSNPQYCISRGLFFLHRWLIIAGNGQTEGQIEDQRVAIYQASQQAPGAISMTCLDSHMAMQWFARANSNHFESDNDWDKGNRSCDWAAPLKPSYMTTTNRAIIKWGFAFWDKDTLEKLGFDIKLPAFDLDS